MKYLLPELTGLFYGLLILGGCSQSEGDAQALPEPKELTKILFACRSGGDEYKIIELSAKKGQPVHFTLRISANKTSTVRELALSQPTFGAKYYGNASTAQLSFAGKDSRYLVFSQTGAVKDDAGEYHSGDFLDGIVIWTGSDSPQVRLCDAPYYSDLAWGDLDKRFSKAALIDLDQLIPPS